MAFLNTTKISTNRRFLMLSALLVLVMLSVSACGTKSSETSEAQSKEVSCVTGQASYQTVPQTVTATGLNVVVDGATHGVFLMAQPAGVWVDTSLAIYSTVITYTVDEVQ